MKWKTKLLNPTPSVRTDFVSLSTPVYRGSTVLFKTQSEVSDDWRQTENGYSYGLYGTPTTLELASKISKLENSYHTFIVPGGQAAIALVYLAYCKSGQHALVPFSAYGPNKEMASGLLHGLGIEVETYNPTIGSDISQLIRKNTALIWCESPGSVTMEVQDVPAIAKVGKKMGVPVALDNTYSAGILFDAFKSGVDVSIQALTKYVGGHSDILLGSVSSSDKNSYSLLGATYRQLGLAVSPDDCSLALRGLQTLGVRLEQFEISAFTVANWLSKQKAVKTVLHPALSSCPGHEIWRRDFLGSSSVFSFLFKEKITKNQVKKFVDNLLLFKIGLSWGGINSLAVIYPSLDRPFSTFDGRLVRLNIGLEDTTDLINDLSNSLKKIELNDG